MLFTVRDVLREAIARLERGWCQHTSAVDSLGNAVNVDSEYAVAWCLGGAVSATWWGFDPQSCKEHIYEQAMESIDREVEEAGYESFTRFNDKAGRTQGEVIDLAKRALARVTS